jgi:DNA invertase Pin-like site-specific DNA recombinase
MRGKFVAYYRVSSDKQGRSGLGLDAQRKAVLDYLDGGKWEMLEEFTEVESCKNSDPPEVKKAIAFAKKHRARLVIAKLDRLSRNVAFIATLLEKKVDFVAVDNPHATKFNLHILAAVAEFERDAISKRTREALAAAKARSLKLDDPEIGQRSRVAADAHAESLREIVTPLAGQTTRAIANALNDRGISAPRGGLWQ